MDFRAVLILHVKRSSLEKALQAFSKFVTEQRNKINQRQKNILPSNSQTNLISNMQVAYICMPEQHLTESPNYNVVYTIKPKHSSSYVM